MNAGFGIVAAGRLALAAALARRARVRGDHAAQRWHVLAALRAAFPGGAALGGEILGCEPVTHSRGGFFSTIAVTDGGRRFAKCVPAGGAEARFWKAWERGHVRTGGRLYRLVPPVAVASEGFVTVLVFPELRVIAAARRRKRARYGRRIDDIARAIADFNSDHLSLPEPLPPSRTCNRSPVPGTREVREALAVDAARARDIVGTLRRIEAGWDPVRDRAYRAPRCLCHMDLGPGNIVFHDGAAVIHDFGHAAMAPPGADLHPLPRYAGATADRLAATYAEVFADKGLDVDAGAVRLAAEAHFAARYRNLRMPSARNLPTFDAAVATSLALIDPAG